MGRDLFGRDAFFDELIEHASQGTNTDLKKLCTKGPARLLDETKNLQPALGALSLALLQRLTKAGIKPVATAGHSLGELPALVASNMADPLSVVRLATIRGQLMHEAATRQKGGMIAVTGLPVEEVASIVKSFTTKGIVSPAAVNAPQQMTISGDPILLAEVGKLLSGKPNVRITRLQVSGAWHSPHMASAVKPFRQALDELELHPPSIPMLFNRTGCLVPIENDVRDIIAQQLTCPIRFDLTMQGLMGLRITDYVEIGPGHVLRSLVRLNCKAPEVIVHNVSDLRSLDRTVSALR